MKIQFRNELGNDISIKVIPVGIGTHLGVNVTMVGPTSTMDNTMTLMEVAYMYEMIGKFLENLRHGEEH